MSIMVNQQNAQPPSTNQAFAPKLLVLARLGDEEPVTGFNPQI